MTYSHGRFYRLSVKKKAIILFITVCSLSGCGPDMAVTRPSRQLDKYPLVIYLEGQGYEKNEPFTRQEISRVLSDAGFLVWVPERKPVSQDPLKALDEAEYSCKKTLEKALRDPAVDKNNIHVIGFCLGSLAAFNSMHPSNIRSMILMDFGAPFYDPALYNKVHASVNTADYGKISSGILVIISSDDDKLSLEPAEILRGKMAEAKNKIDCIEYFAKDRQYLQDALKYLTGQRIDTVERIEVNSQHLEKWNRIRKSGYW
ncbi:MAG: dienelactone hydrolase family protein [Candidatus Omnitrophica bacterium]|nr:dienelactone hydrolase family protein [Candidatus Omnitrophota bacterium]MDD5552727.1 dienelactone hydrolase family protein [Candidatus Omnitrophota bacterium]